MTEITKKKRKKLSLPKKTVERLVQSVIDAQNAEIEAPEAPKSETQPETTVSTQENAQTTENTRQNETPVVETPVLVAPHRAVRDNEEKEPVKVDQPEILWRDAVIEEIDRSNDAEKRTITLSFSSETPVQRNYGKEVLSHNPGDVDLQRLNSAGPVLLDHNTTKQVGVVQKAWIGADKKGRASVQFSKNQLATEVWNDIQDGIRRNVSVGYEVNGRPEVSGDVYRWSWTPSHIAIVSEPADITVGINRSTETTEVKNEVVLNTNTTTNTLTKGVNTTMSDATVTAVNPADTIKAERSRVNEIRAIAKQFSTNSELQSYADKAIEEGTDLSVFQSQAFKMLETKNAVKTVDTSNDVGLTRDEARKFSIGKMLRHLSDVGNKKLADEAGFEIEACKAAEKQYGATRRSETSFILPFEVQRTSHNRQQRNINLSSGAYAIETEVDTGSWVDYLYNATQVIAAGATVLPGLVNNIQIPVTSTANTITWLATDGTSAGTETDITISKINLACNNAMGYTAYTRAALQQVPGLDAILERNLAEAMAVGLDAAYLNGSGSSGQPKGIANVSGVGSVAFGSGQGGAPTYKLMMQFIQKLAAANALTVPGHKAWLIGANAMQTLSTTLKDSANTASNYILGGVTGDLTKMCGYDVLVSNNVLENVTVGSETDCSQVFFGNWSEAVVGMFYTEFLVNPYLLSTTNQIALFVYQGTDIALKHPVSFAVANDLITDASA